MALAAAQILYNQILPVCPIDGVAVGDVADRSTWRVDFDPTATPAQRAAAANVIATFDLAGAVSADATRTSQLNTDPDYVDLLNKLRGATAGQIKQYVQNNVFDLASAKVLLAKILLILARTI